MWSVASDLDRRLRGGKVLRLPGSSGVLALVHQMLLVGQP